MIGMFVPGSRRWRIEPTPAQRAAAGRLADGWHGGGAVDPADLAAIHAEWSVVSVASHRWEAWLDDCRRHDVDGYLPLEPCRLRRHVGRRTEVVETARPIYPGYAFVPVHQVARLHRVRGCYGPVEVNGRRFVINGAEIRRIRLVEADRSPPVSPSVFDVGSVVRVVRGLMEGSQGVVVAPRSARHVTVEVTGCPLLDVPASCLATIG